MGIFYKTEKRDLQYNEEDLQMMVSTLPGFQGSNIREYASVDAIKHSDVFTAVTMIASDLARMPIRLMENREIDYNNRITHLLNTRPNAVYNGYIFKLVVFINALLTSHGYVEIIRDKLGLPEALVFRKTSEVQLKVSDGGYYYYKFRTITENGKMIERKINFDDMLDIKFYSLDGINGLSLLDTLNKTIDADNNGKDFLNNFLRNGTHAGGILKMKGVLNDKKARNRAREEFHRAFSGTKQAGKVVVLDESMTFDQLEVDTEVLKLIRENKSSTREIAGVFGIPLHKFGVETTNMSITDANLDYLSTLKPYTTCVCAELNFKFNDEITDDFKEFIFDTTEIRVVDEKTQAEIDKINLDSGKTNIDEIRKRDGLPPIPGGHGSIHRVDLNHVNISLVDEYQMNKSKGTDNKLKGGEQNG
ncbi:phage portal protein [Staphylococcus simulans]|uniref:phage portal protein n=1 Tax=Staphylococcus TaxID=1279 RepID=UPI0008A93F01|nr:MULTISPECIES: phage portal protein [Staphylococcus]MCE5023481.1 phage portal protein [Staphylococcus simulans]MDK7928124.1 phage portal protein [Staphylococcus simulans]MDK8316787.1 phage portal protein [Staphylococcus simulans]MDQ7113536.1 phage portal protein [Staphylococcus simulans]MDQ7114510.1 phage portal protein [Staphylococcus simulans]